VESWKWLPVRGEEPPQCGNCDQDGETQARLGSSYSAWREEDEREEIHAISILEKRKLGSGGKIKKGTAWQDDQKKLHGSPGAWAGPRRAPKVAESLD